MRTSPSWVLTGTLEVLKTGCSWRVEEGAAKIQTLGQGIALIVLWERKNFIASCPGYIGF
jgi:hypothetical protein